MGFFDKIWKGIKSGVKSIGKGIKSAAKKVGKFMDKIGIVGQIALMFVLPGIGAMLGRGIGLMAGAANPILSGVGKVLQTAGKFANTVGNAFKTVSDGITGFVSKVGGSVVNSTTKMLGGSGTLISSAPSTVSEGFSQWMTGVADDVMNIPSPFRAQATATSTAVDEMFEKAFDPATYTKDMSLDQKDFKFYEVPPANLEAIKTAEINGNGGFIKSVADTVKEMPTTILNKGAEAASEAVVNKGLQAVGLDTTPTYTQNSYTTVTPKFDSTPISTVYEQNGIGYGGLPDNRIQFLAAQQIPQSDYGIGAFNRFRQIGVS